MLGLGCHLLHATPAPHRVAPRCIYRFLRRFALWFRRNVSRLSGLVWRGDIHGFIGRIDLERRCLPLAQLVWRGDTHRRVGRIDLGRGCVPSPDLSGAAMSAVPSAGSVSAFGASGAPGTTSAGTASAVSAASSASLAPAFGAPTRLLIASKQNCVPPSTIVVMPASRAAGVVHRGGLDNPCREGIRPMRQAP